MASATPIEANETRAIRTYLTDICAQNTSLSGQTMARLYCFVDSLATTITRVAGPMKQEITTSDVMEPIDREIAANVVDLEKRIEDLLPRISEYRQTTKRKVENALEASLAAREAAFNITGKWSNKNPSLDAAVPIVSEAEAQRLVDDATVIRKLHDDVRAMLPRILDNAESNLTALRNVPFEELAAKAELRQPEPRSPSLEGARDLSESLVKRMREDRDRLLRS